MTEETTPQQELIRLTLSDRPVPDIQIDGLPSFEAGWVWLAGAGPGDPGLLTLHAVNALKQADCVVYDALVSEDILSLVRLRRNCFTPVSAAASQAGTSRILPTG